MLGQNCFPSLSNCWRCHPPDRPEMNVTAQGGADKKKSTSGSELKWLFKKLMHNLTGAISS